MQKYELGSFLSSEEEQALFLAPQCDQEFYESVYHFENCESILCFFELSKKTGLILNLF
jgi:hypothetical protein